MTKAWSRTWENAEEKCFPYIFIPNIHIYFLYIFPHRGWGRSQSLGQCWLLGSGVRNQHAEGISAEGGGVVGKVESGYEGSASSHAGRLETSNGKSGQQKPAVC